MGSIGLDGGGVEHQALRQLSVGKHSGTLASRIVAVAFVSVLAAVAIAMLVAFPLVRNEAELQARQDLARQANVVADVIRQSGSVPLIMDGRGQHRRPTARVDVVIVNAGTPAAGVITSSMIKEVTGGGDVFSDDDAVADSDSETEEPAATDFPGSISARQQFNNEWFFVEGRQISAGVGVFLIQRATSSQDAASTLLGRMGFGLIAGLGLAGLLALFVAGRIAAPMKKAANAATQLAEGSRDVDVEISGAEEVADIARALNLLAANLAMSEDRQREFFMSVSHELRTPMTAVKGYAEALADGVIDGPDVAPTGALLVNETQRLDRLISDLLDLARSGAVDFRLAMTVTDLSSIVTASAESWRMRCERESINFESAVPHEPVTAVVDPTRYRQIIDNLIENAVRVTPSGGTIRMQLHQTAAGSELRIDDSGPGLSDDDLAVAFEPAVLHSRYRGVRAVGTGLGLALVGSLATRMGGAVHAAHSELGGARFVVQMPQREASTVHD